MDNVFKPTIDKYKSIFSISNDLASTMDINTILDRITHNAIDLLDAQVGSILLYDPVKERLFFRSATNMQNYKELHQIIVPKESLAGWVAQNRQAMIIDDVHQDKRFSDLVEKNVNYETQNMCIAPMIVKDKLIGVLEVLNKKTGQFNEDDKDILTALGTQAAVAIENARLFHQSDTIADLVHELRTPLNAINTITYLLLRPEITSDQRSTFIATIQQETERLSELVTNFLDFSRLESGREQFTIESFDIIKLAEECLLIISPKAQDKQIGITMQNGHNGPFFIQSDRNKLKQVLLNLLSNSIKYNKENGKVSICIDETEQCILIIVEDTGIGIAEKDIEELFHKYYRANDVHQSIQGTGLGLAICKRIVDQLNGTIFVESELNKGTKITISLHKKD